jgi:hypothetical protein
MNEYFLNDLLEEAVEVMKETVHPNAGAEAVRVLIRTVLEKKDTERKKFNIFLPALFTSGVFGQEQVCQPPLPAPSSLAVVVDSLYWLQSTPLLLPPSFSVPRWYRCIPS